MPIQQVTISINAQKTLLADIYERHCIEACGLLTGSIDGLGNWHIEQAHPLPNIFNSPVYFEFAPEDVLAIELDHPDQIVGAYHTHPSGLAVASRTDRENMKRVNLEQQIPWVWFIISGPFDKPVTSLQPLNTSRATLDKSSSHEGSIRASLRSAEGSYSHRTERAPRPAIIAYHYYEQYGLRQVNIQLEEALKDENRL